MKASFESMAGAVLVQFLTGALSYFAVVGLVFFGVWHLGRERFRWARIPAPSRFGRDQVIREVGNTCVTLFAGMASGGAVVALRAAGWTRLSEAPVGALEILAWVVAGILVNDAWFYGWHRMLHHPLLFRHVHAVHHRSIDVNPFTSYSFHAVEAMILGLWIVPAAMVLPVPMLALGILQIVGLLNNVMAHLGYEFLPRWILRVPVLRWTNTATFHSLHHTRPGGNFGLHTRIWDRVFGTEIPGYERVFIERGGAEAVPASGATP
jgi:sterol desaturase/sphingolipid hydroxylase (fatty acid hydroxylase superfamily)